MIYRWLIDSHRWIDKSYLTLRRPRVKEIKSVHPILGQPSWGSCQLEKKKHWAWKFSLPGEGGEAMVWLPLICHWWGEEGPLTQGQFIHTCLSLLIHCLWLNCPHTSLNLGQVPGGLNRRIPSFQLKCKTSPFQCNITKTLWNYTRW